MNFLAFAVLAWIFFGLEMGLKKSLELGQSGIAPGIVFVLVVYVAMFAPQLAALWCAFILGASMDVLTGPNLRDGAGQAAVFGPHALGYVLAAQFSLVMRGVMNRRNPLSVAFLALFGAIIAEITVVALYSLRAWYGDPIVWQASGELLRRIGAAAYTGLAGFVLSLALLPIAPLLGFDVGQQRRFSRVR